ncbi:MAG: PorP/SprF family type IX secretion system membrane protein [Bacteroidales bacterium]|nr:PorP/SprF family type IX secretion system membrane protein [Bacteroidales bacterium]
MKKIFLLSGILLVAIFSHAQDPHFTQYNMPAMFLNPALTGNYNGDFRADINYRDQWRSVAEPFTTYQLSADAPVSRSNNAQFSIGGYVMSDKSGASEFSQTIAGINLGAGVRLNSVSSLSAGIGGGIISQNVNMANLSWDSQYNGMQYDPALETHESASLLNATGIDLNAGIVYKFMSGSRNPYYNDGVKGTIGIAAFHLTSPEQITSILEDKRYAKIVAHADFSIGISGSNTAIQPSFLFMTQGSSTMIMLGLSFRYLLKESSRYTGFIKSSAFTVGGHYRVGDAIAFTSMIEFSNFAIGFSYDINASGLSKASNGAGALELALRFVTPAPNKARLGNNPLY